MGPHNCNLPLSVSRHLDFLQGTSPFFLTCWNFLGVANPEPSLGISKLSSGVLCWVICVGSGECSLVLILDEKALSRATFRAENSTLLWSGLTFLGFGGWFNKARVFSLSACFFSFSCVITSCWCWSALSRAGNVPPVKKIVNTRSGDNDHHI